MFTGKTALFAIVKFPVNGMGLDTILISGKEPISHGLST
jgi:hypothetical protein